MTLNFKKLAVTLLLFVILFLPGASLAAENKVLLLNSYHSNFPTSGQIIAGIDSILANQGIKPDIEYLDSKRIYDAKHLDNLLQLLEHKLAHRSPYDLVIASDDNAYTFARTHQKKLFRNAPIVFCGVNNLKAALEADNEPGITGVVEAVSMADTLRLMRKLNPGLRQVYAVVDGTPSGQGDLKSFLLAGSKVPGLELKTLDMREMTYRELAAKLRSLGNDSAVLLLSCYVDATGRRIGFDNAVRLISQSSARPVYHLWFHGLGQGLIGGKVISHFEQGRTAAELGLKILKGTPASILPVITTSPNTFVFDYKQLERFGLEPASLPPGSTLLNRPVSVWEAHYEAILISLFLILFFGAIIVVLVFNIQKRKNAELRMLESRKTYRDMFMRNSSIMWLVDPETSMIVDANPKATEFYGYSREELSNMGIGQINTLGPDGLKREMDAVKSGERSYFNFEHRIKDGSLKNVEVYSCPIMIRGKKHLLSIIHDVTARRQVEKEKSLMEAHLRQKQKIEAIGTLAGGIAHDFNNLLAIILGYLEMSTEAEELSLDTRENLEQAYTAAGRAKDLVGQILSFSRRTEAKAGPVELGEVVKESVHFLKAVLPANVNLEVKLDGPRKRVWADPTKIQQIIMNLCTNAAHSMQPAGGPVTISLDEGEPDINRPELSEMEPGRYMVLRVSDQGVGMDDHTREKIFQPFFTTKDPGQGTGMGLAVVQGIVGSLNGGVTVDSSPGQGSTFLVYLPIRDEESAAGKVSTHLLDRSGSGETILLAEDEIALRLLLKDGLERMGYSVDVYENGEKALAAFEENSRLYDILVTDLAMPGISGLQLSAAVHELYPGLPIILISGYADAGAEEEARRVGVGHIMPKPFSLNDLAGLIRHCLKTSQATNRTMH